MHSESDSKRSLDWGSSDIISMRAKTPLVGFILSDLPGQANIVTNPLESINSRYLSLVSFTLIYSLTTISNSFLR